MAVQVRPYNPATDYEPVSRFFIDVYEPTERLLNWMQPRWEYMHHHPFIADVPLETIGVFEDDGRIVGLAHPEDKLTFVYFQRRPGYDHILPAMFAHAATHFGGPSIMLERNIIGLFINDFDAELQSVARSFGYERHPEHHDGYSKYDLTQAIPAAPIPNEYHIQSLADKNNQRKINECLWRGFNHEGDISEEDAAAPAVAQSAPNFRKDRTIVAVDSHGDYVAYAGIWHVPENGCAYVEPVATDPLHRGKGLARACVLESLRRVQAAGATVAWVGSDQEFYSAIGFEKKFQRDLWVKWLD
ncbi:MAG: GNAT family N-acetyltransferase [bacterium]|nr:GNAT family N-acetyltransferase [bacterium]